ncbi:hypothetical protein Bca4012_035342 [Brassica carinata]
MDTKPIHSRYIFFPNPLTNNQSHTPFQRIRNMRFTVTPVRRNQTPKPCRNTPPLTWRRFGEIHSSGKSGAEFTGCFVLQSDKSSEEHKDNFCFGC